MSEELERAAGTDLEVVEASLVEEFQAKLAEDEVAVPMVKPIQATTKNPPEGSKPGDFVNTLTGTIYGPTIDLIVVDKNRGRFYADEDNDRVYVAQGEICPWVDTPWHGLRFDEIPDAEERFRERANNNEVEWGKGPPITTTHNYIGLVAEDLAPVRLSLYRSQVPAARKINSILRMQRRAPWDVTIHLATERQTSKRGEPYYGIVATQGRATTPEERQEAVEVAVAIRNAGPREQQAAEPEAPDATAAAGDAIPLQ